MKEKVYSLSVLHDAYKAFDSMNSYSHVIIE